MKLKAKLNITNKLFWALASPAFAFSLLTCLLLLSTRFSDLDNNLNDRTEYITEQIATASEYAIIFSDQNMIYRILQNALNHKDISSVQLFNQEQKITAELGKPSSNIEYFFPDFHHINEYEHHLVSTKIILHTTYSTDGTSSAQINAFNQSNKQRLLGWIRVEADKSAVQIEKYQYAGIIIFLLFIFNVLVILGAAHLSKKLAEPINIFSGSLNKLIKGQFSTVKLMKLPPEYAALQKDLLDLTERLENHNEELIIGIEQSTEDIRRNMDSMEEKSAQLHIANREAMESSKLKSQFLANISHEIRTPLNAILGYTKTLQKDVKDTQQRLYVDTIQQSTNNLLAVIGDILDFSKIEAGKLNLESNHFNLRSLIEDVYQILNINLITKEKQIDLIPELDNDMPEWFIGDSTRVRQILMNLIGNAIKFTHQGSIRTKVSTVSSDTKGIVLSFQIIDTGIGIPEHKMNRLFKPFSQVDSSTTRKFGGTGLGLVITKKLVEQMNGKIEVSSAPNIGSTFRFTLCLKASPKIKDNITPLNRHVILLEPSTTYRSYMNKYLHDIGVNCTLCSDLEQMVRIINKQKDTTDAILLSVTPDEESIKEAKELITYAFQQFNIACILMIQPPGQIAHYSDLKDYCSDILLKPVSQDRLYSAIKDIENTSRHIENTIEHADNKTLFEAPLPQPETEVKSFTGLKILAVDDTPINLQLLSHWLAPNGIEIYLAHSGRQAIDMAKTETFDMIFMDIQMPEMDGMDTTRQLRLLENYQDIPIIALTAHALGSEQEHILASGMNGYLTKPIDEEILLNTIDTWRSNTQTLEDQIKAKLVNVFDIEKALDIVDGKADIAKEMFDMLADSLDAEKKLIQHHLEKKDTKKLIEVVHRIHGASKYSGTTNMARHAGFLETHLKELGLEDVDGVADDFIKTIEDLLNHRQLIRWPQTVDSSTTNA